jgi:hypothetical protein
MISYDVFVGLVQQMRAAQQKWLRADLGSSFEEAHAAERRVDRALVEIAGGPRSWWANELEEVQSAECRVQSSGSRLSTLDSQPSPQCQQHGTLSGPQSFADRADGQKRKAESGKRQKSAAAELPPPR